MSSLVKHTDRKRFELVIGTMRPPPSEAGSIPGLRLHALPIEGRKDYPRAIVALARWLRENCIDVVQTHLFDATVVGLSAARLARTPLTIVTGHHSHEFAVSPPSVSFFLDALCTSRLADRVIVPSAFMREAMLSVFPIPPEHIAVVPHGLDERRLISPAGARVQLRRALGIEDRVVVGAIGRLYWIKQYENLVRSFAAVAHARPELVLLIVGEGEQRAQLQALARELTVEDRIMWLGPRGDVPGLLAAMDIFVHPALTESFGLVLVEAMAAGKPLLSTAVGVAPQIVIDGETGLLVPARDPQALTRGLERLLGMRERWPAMGENAQRVAREFTAPKMVAAYEGLTSEWCSTSRRRAP
jgi:glycosyltransferase involved in cell wall biosynthesis